MVGQEGESACVIEGVETREGLCSQMVRIVEVRILIHIHGIDKSDAHIGSKGLDDYRAKRWVEDPTNGDEQQQQSERRRRRGGKKGGRRFLAFSYLSSSSSTSSSSSSSCRLAVGERSKDMEAIHYINKLNKAPEVLTIIIIIIINIISITVIIIIFRVIIINKEIIIIFLAVILILIMKRIFSSSEDAVRRFISWISGYPRELKLSHWQVCLP